MRIGRTCAVLRGVKSTDTSPVPAGKQRREQARHESDGRD
jgi:hypothetical protein